MPKGLPFFIIVWIIGMILGSTYDGNSTSATWGGLGTGSYSENPQDTMKNLTNANQASQQLAPTGPISYIAPLVSFFQSWFKVIMLQFDFVKPYPMFQWIFSAIGAMGLVATFTLIYGIIRGNITFGIYWLPLFTNDGLPRYNKKNKLWVWREGRNV